MPISNSNASPSTSPLSVATSAPSQERYVEHKKIGNGSTGQVYQAWDTQENKHVAIKQEKEVEEKNLLPHLVREIMMLRVLKHPNIAAMVEVMKPKQSISSEEPLTDTGLVLEHLESDLRATIRKSKKASKAYHLLTKVYLYQLLCAVNYMHSAGVLHRDIKPANCLIQGDTLKLCDFGLARFVSMSVFFDDAQEVYKHRRRLSHHVVTRFYRSPEVLLFCPYAKPVDMWSVGCTLAEMISGKVLFPGESSRLSINYALLGSSMPGHDDQLEKIFDVIGTPSAEDIAEIKNIDVVNYLVNHKEIPAKDFSTLFPKTVDPLVIDLLKRMLTFNPEKRITAKEALEHPYLKDLPKQYPFLKGLKEKTFDASIFKKKDESLTDAGKRLCWYYMLEFGDYEKFRKQFWREVMLDHEVVRQEYKLMKSGKDAQNASEEKPSKISVAIPVPASTPVPKNNKVWPLPTIPIVSLSSRTSSSLFKQPDKQPNNGSKLSNFLKKFICH